MFSPYNLYNLEAPFRKYLLAENVKTATLKNYLSDLKHFSGWLAVEERSGDTEELKSILTSELVQKYKKYLLECGLPLKTVNRRLSTLRKFCSFCISQGWLTENPAKQVQNVILPSVIPTEAEAMPAGRQGSLDYARDDKPEAMRNFKKSLEREGFSDSEINVNIADVNEYLTFAGSN